MLIMKRFYKQYLSKQYNVIKANQHFKYYYFTIIKLDKYTFGLFLKNNKYQFE